MYRKINAFILNFSINTKHNTMVRNKTKNNIEWRNNNNDNFNNN